jgi:hypothetical protein
LPKNEAAFYELFDTLIAPEITPEKKSVKKKKYKNN